MSNSVRFDGLNELKAALRQLPAELAQEATGSVERATSRTAAAVKQAYPEKEGRLRAGVRQSVKRTSTGVTGEVKSTSPEAHLWEFGTQIRATRQGWNRGRAPAHRAEGLIPIAQRERKTMHAEQIEIVRRAGFEVSGVI